MPISRIKTDGIQDDAITSAKIGVDVIIADDLAANSVTVSEITNGAVTSAKLDTNIDIAGTLDVTGTLTADSNLLVGSTTSVGNANANELELTNPVGSGTVGMTFNVNSGSSDTGNIYWRSTTSNNNIQIVGDPVDNYLKFVTAAVNRLLIDSAGNVGIGTSSPLDLVHILEANGTNTSTQLMLQNNNLGSGTAGIAFNVTATGETASYAPKGAILFERTATNGRGAFKFIVDNVDDTNPFSASDEVMRISADGNVGIGTTTPSETLDVSGDARATRLIGRQLMESTSGVGSDTFSVVGGTSSNASTSHGAVFFSKHVDSYALLVGTHDATFNSFAVKGNGNVGIGTTGPQTALHLYGGDNATSLLTLDDTGTGGGRKWSFRPGDPVTPSNGYFSFRDETAGENRIVITDGGEVRVGHGLATTQIRIQAGGSVCRTFGNTSGSGFHFTTNAIYPTNFAGSLYDANISLGSGSYRYATIFATNGTINTSDLNEKQDIENLSDAERTVANAIKGLIKKFRFIDAVEKKGDDARIHVGVIAQDVEQVFVDAGLNPRRYGMFCEDIWYEVDGEINPDEPYTADTPNAVRKVRLGIRYDELLAFVISAL